MPEEALNPELAAVAAALHRLAPAPARIDRDRLLYRAGQASVPQPGWFWPGATAAMALLATALGLFATVRPGPQQVTGTVFAHLEPTVAPAPAIVETRSPAAEDRTVAILAMDPRPETLSGFRLERLAVRWGLDAIPSSPTTAAEPSGPPTRLLDLRGSRQLETETP